MIMIAPGHDELDYRVLRSYKQISKVYSECSLYLEKSRVSSGFLEGDNIKLYSEIPFIDLFFLKGKHRYNDFFDRKLNGGWIYVHDSGLYGIFLIRYINHYFPDVKLIFDYHDFLDWEILHHVKKISNNNLIQRLALKLILYSLTSFVTPFLKINALVGISSAQLDHFKNNFRLKEVPFKKTVPNTRSYLDSNFPVIEGDCKNNFLWVGNVGGNRLFEKINYYTGLLGSLKPKVIVEKVVVGKVWGTYSESLSDVNYLGSFRNDADILKLLSREKYIGLFFGWEDVFDLGINGIGSPNKVYSYINLCVPFLIPSTLHDFIKVCEVDECFLYKNDEDFLVKAKCIFNDYSYYCLKVRKLKEAILWDENLNSSLFDFYAEVKS